MTDLRSELRSEARSWWWVFLITGILWLVVALIILRFTAASLATISVLAGAVMIVAGVNEFLIAGLVRSWRWLHLVLGGLFVVVGIIAMVNPGATFWALASLIGWYLLFKGTLDIVTAVLSRNDGDLWWLGLIVGIAEILLAFWAAGGFGRQALLLVVWAAAAALARGITEIVTAFTVRAAGRGGTGSGYVERDQDGGPAGTPGRPVAGTDEGAGVGGGAHRAG